MLQPAHGYVWRQVLRSRISNRPGSETI
jgi:hypothetical protein